MATPDEDADASDADASDADASDADASDASDASGDDEGSASGSSAASDASSSAAGAGMKLAACAVDFNVGFFADRASGFEGISHFLEHMVFMGSEKYPGENHFSDWLSRHWGSENACTDSEQTTYYFECHPKHLREGLDIFSGYFLSPLLKMDAVEREVTAVESEFERVVNNDASRVEAVLGHLARPDHAYGVFGWGNRRSLTENPLWVQGKIREALMEHWRKHYHAGRMSLCVLGEQGLDELQGMVGEIFGEMRGGGEPATDFAAIGPPYPPDALPLMVRTAQVREGKQLDLVFTVPSALRRAYRRKSTEYVEELIGHEGEGSLFALLKSRGLADRIGAGVGAGGLADTTCCALFTATIKLTDEGYERVDEVISLFFQYAEMMRRTGPQEWFWRETKQLRAIEFRFKEEEGAADYTEAMAMTMRRYAHEDVLRGEYVHDEFAPGDIADVLATVVPSKCVFVVSDSAFDPDAPGTERERWFDVPFRRESIDPERLKRWETCEPDKALSYPPRNAFIAERFELASGGRERRLRDAEARGLAAPPPPPLVTPPEIVHECAAMRLWHRMDDKYDQPRTCAYFYVSLPAIDASPEAYVAADMLTAMTHDRLQDAVRYPAELASLNAGLDVVGMHTALSFTFDGFSDKLPKLVDAYFGAVAAFDFDDRRFEKVKEKRLKDLKNYGLKPGRQARALLLRLLKQREDSEAVKIAALEAMDAAALRHFASSVWSAAAHVEGLVVGNVTAEDALAMGASIRAKLRGGPIAPDAFPERRIAVVPPGDARFAVPTQNPEEGTNVVYAYYQHGVATHDIRATSLLVHQLIGEKLFDQLRTKEQLGYVASGSLETLYDISGFRVTVESAFHAPSFVEERINAFLAGFPRQIREMDDGEFLKTRRSLADSILTADVSLSAEADRHWTHVSNQKYQFYRGQIIASMVEKISKEDVVDWLEANLNPTNPACRRITVFVHGKNHPLASRENDSAEAPRALGADDVARVKAEWEPHPAQGDPRTVPELEPPPEDVAKLSNTDLDAIRAKKAAGKAADDAGGGARSNQWAQRMADRRAQCAAGCACLKPSAGGPFKMPRLTKK